METNNYTSSTSGNGASTGASNASASGAAKTMYNDSKTAAQRTGANLRQELSGLKNDLDTLVERSSSMSDEELSQAHARMMAKFSSMRYAARGMADEATRQINRGVETTNQYVKEKPIQSVGLAAGAGLILGMLFSRR